MFSAFRKEKEITKPGSGAPPAHVAIIMDGNRRWAKQHGLPILEGHRRGSETLKEIVRTAAEENIRYLTVWAFSTENWKRDQNEVAGLISLIRVVLKRDLAELHENGVRLKFIGDISRFDSDVLQLINTAIELTRDNTRITLIIALNYGFRNDMIQAVQQIAKRVEQGEIKAENVTEDMISSALSTADYPNPDLLIRTSGEQRVSNYMMWEISYTELYFTNIYWPDFGAAEFRQALDNFSKRQRRFGGN